MYMRMTFFLVTLPVSQNVTQNSRTPVIPQKRNIVTVYLVHWLKIFSDCIRANSPDYVILCVVQDAQCNSGECCISAFLIKRSRGLCKPIKMEKNTVLTSCTRKKLNYNRGKAAISCNWLRLYNTKWSTILEIVFLGAFNRHDLKYENDSIRSALSFFFLCSSLPIITL